MRQVARTATVNFGCFARQAEIFNQCPATGQLLFVFRQTNYFANVTKVAGQTKVQSVHTGAPPLGFVHADLVVLGQTRHLKRGVVRSLDDGWVPETLLYVLRNLFTRHQVDHVYFAVAKRVGKQHDLKVVGLDVLVHAALFQVDVAVCLKVNS